MKPPASRPRTHLARTLALVLALGAAAGAVRPGASQTLAGSPKIGPTSRLTLVRTGTFEAWQDTARLGTEFYTVYTSPKRDSLISFAAVHYTLHDRHGVVALDKWTVSVLRALDSFPLLYQNREQLGGRERSFSISTQDTTASFFREIGDSGSGKMVVLPPGRLYILDPGVYTQVEEVAGDFYARGAPVRVQNVVIAPRDTIVSLHLTRGGQETIELPGRGRVNATRIDLYDDLTLIQAWLDEHGRLLQVLAPAQKLRVVRLPPGQAEADAAAEAKGAPLEAKGASTPGR
jgi:hypothetical protein